MGVALLHRVTGLIRERRKEQGSDTQIFMKLEFSVLCLFDVYMWQYEKFRGETQNIGQTTNNS